MKKIGLLSDTHGYIDARILEHFAQCDEIWHAGDIGTIEVAVQYEKAKLFRAVHGNIDGQPLRLRYPKDLRFLCEEVDVFITHIGGYPGNYSPDARRKISDNPPKLFISGHSHILKVMRDKKMKNMIHLYSIKMLIKY